MTRSAMMGIVSWLFPALLLGFDLGFGGAGCGDQQLSKGGGVGGGGGDQGGADQGGVDPGSGGSDGSDGSARGNSDLGGSAEVPAGPLDLCAGLVTDQKPRPMTALAKPNVGELVTDAELGTRIRRITTVAASGSNPAIRPVYSTVSAWNADESRLMLYNVQSGAHLLYDGKTYQPIKTLDVSPPDLEQVYWDTTDPDLLYYVDGKTAIRYHVEAGTKEKLTTFDFCADSVSGGSDPMFTSLVGERLGLRCGDQVFIYDIPSKSVLARKTYDENPAQLSASGNFGYLSDSGRVTDAQLNVLRTLDLKEPFGHASMSRLPTGEDTWNGQVFDEGPNGNDDIGSLVVFNLATGASRTIIGPKTGWPYPPDGHVSAMAYRQPGWIFVSTFGNTSGAGLLDLEMLIADTSTGKVCRAGRHRSWGKNNTKLAEPYWAEAHTTPSPSGTRAVFASDWGGGPTVDTYVLELPAYRP